MVEKPVTAGEPCAVKVASTVRRGAGGKGRSRLPVTADALRAHEPGKRRTSPSAYPTSWRPWPRSGGSASGQRSRSLPTRPRRSARNARQLDEPGRQEGNRGHEGESQSRLRRPAARITAVAGGRSELPGNRSSLKWRRSCDQEWRRLESQPGQAGVVPRPSRTSKSRRKSRSKESKYRGAGPRSLDPAHSLPLPSGSGRLVGYTATSMERSINIACMESRVCSLRPRRVADSLHGKQQRSSNPRSRSSGSCSQPAGDGACC